jgi:hypothetical protein
MHIRDCSKQQLDRQGRPAQAAADYCDRTAHAILILRIYTATVIGTHGDLG